MGAVGGVADVDLGVDAGGFLVALAKGGGEGHGVIGFDEVDGASTESAAGEAGADETWQVLGEIDHDVALGATAFEILTVADVGFGHEAADGGEVVTGESVGAGDGAQIFGDDVTGALERVGWDFVAPGG